MLILIVLLSVAVLVLTAVIISRLSAQGREMSHIERSLREEIAASRRELTGNFDNFTAQFLKLTEINENKLEGIRETVERKLSSLQEDNNRKLEAMRETVDEKLHSTLEKRLGESFTIVSQRLEKVHQGLGEMQNLASGVGDLKKVLTNVKTRGTWGEIQLGLLLEQLLTRDQYEENVITKKGSRDPVEFAIKLPGKDHNAVYIPIDAKFPKEDFERLLNAQDQGDAPAVENYSKQIENRIKMEARKIRDKYIDPPQTTDFAIMYLPIEGLYAEALRRPGLCEGLQRDFRVTLAGPTTIAAVLNALQMGFRTLAVEKRAGEVWGLLNTVKTEFGKFGDILEKTKEKLEAAGKNIDTAARKSRTIERKLKRVQELPSPEGTGQISAEPFDIAEEEIEDDAIVR